MTITVGHAIAGVLVSAVVLLVIVSLAVRTTKTVHPIRCVHCWKYEGKETVVAYSETPHLWAICANCVHHYWQIDRPVPLNESPSSSRSPAG